jgi:hypothetical protein
VFDDSPDDFVDFVGLGQQQQPSDNFDELFGDENDAPVDSIECSGVKPSSGALVTNDKCESLSGWAF